MLLRKFMMVVMIKGICLQLGGCKQGVTSDVSSRTSSLDKLSDIYLQEKVRMQAGPQWLKALLTAGEVNAQYGMPKALSQVPHSQVVWAIGDLHGDWLAAKKILEETGLARVADPSHVEWTGGNQILVQLGDQVDKGLTDLGVLLIFESLAIQARKAGGQVISLLGNHEFDSGNIGHGGSQTIDYVSYERVPSDKNLEALMDPVDDRLKKKHRGSSAELYRPYFRRIFGAQNTDTQLAIMQKGPLGSPNMALGRLMAFARPIQPEGLPPIKKVKNIATTVLPHRPVAFRIGDVGFFHGGPFSNELHPFYERLLSQKHDDALRDVVVDQEDYEAIYGQFERDFSENGVRRIDSINVGAERFWQQTAPLGRFPPSWYLVLQNRLFSKVQTHPLDPKISEENCTNLKSALTQGYGIKHVVVAHTQQKEANAICGDLAYRMDTGMSRSFLGYPNLSALKIKFVSTKGKGLQPVFEIRNVKGYSADELKETIYNSYMSESYRAKTLSGKTVQDGSVMVKGGSR